MAKIVMRLFDHLFWADQRILQLVEDPAAAGNADVLRLTSHVIAAERVWLARLRGEDASDLPIWPEWSSEELLSAARETRADYERFLKGLEPAELEREVSYTNSRGVEFNTPIVDILTHVAVHGSYHRGQIANAVRRTGGEPVNTDFITYVRELPASRP